MSRFEMRKRTCPFLYNIADILYNVVLLHNTLVNSFFIKEFLALLKDFLIIIKVIISFITKGFKEEYIKYMFSHCTDFQINIIN